MQDKPTEDKKTLEVVYNGKQVHLTFSDITQIFPPEETLERFMVELTQAMSAIRDIRDIQRNEFNQETTRELNEILLHVTTMLANWYGTIRAYVTPDFHVQDQFEEYMGQVIREIGHPIISLCAYWKVIYQETNKQNSQEELLNEFAIIINKIFEILGKYRTK